jgi:hypothetical protein
VADQDHLICCHHPTCAAWRADLLQNIRTPSEHLKTDPVLLDILMEALYAWLHSNPPPNPATYPAAYRQLVSEQTTLGWRQLFNGRWSTEWSRLHGQFILRSFDPIPSKMSGTNWTSTYINLLWTSFRQLWDSRNGKVHGIDTSSRIQAQREKVH